MTDLRKEIGTKRWSEIEREEWSNPIGRGQKKKKQSSCKIDIKGERKGVRHAEKKRLREGERESKGKNNEKIESYIVRQKKKARKTLYRRRVRK